jgi:hypothetical protein
LVPDYGEKRKFIKGIPLAQDSGGKDDPFENEQRGTRKGQSEKV